MPIDEIDDPIDAAAVLAYRVVRDRRLAKATSGLRCFSPAGCSIATGSTVPQSCLPTTVEFADLLVKASAGQDVETQIVALAPAPDSSYAGQS